IDDEPALRQLLTASLARAGHAVDEAGSAAEAAARLARGDVDLALCDIKLGDGNGVDLLRNSRAAGIDTAFLMITAFASVETAVEALRAGAFDYLMKPVRNEELMHQVAQIESVRGLRAENRALRRVVGAADSRMYRFSSPAMADVERLAGKVAPTDSTVLITGESGTGKGVIARWIHESSSRAKGAFLPVNCSAIPEQLLESEFFGHTKGAFTGADRARRGLFVEADRGTIFLDEIGELPPHMQTKLLSVIEEKMVRAIGSDQPRRVDTRVIAATNRDLPEMVKQGKFRDDLYFRLAMFHIHLPPLRERRADLAGFIRHTLAAMARSGGKPGLELDAAAEQALVGAEWPGNVRELENVLNRACILADGGRITLADLPADITRIVPGPLAADAARDAEGSLRQQLRALEARLIARALQQANDDRRVAAERLGIGLSSLYRKLDEFERLGVA
ncbi:MAG: sigma-54-dependent transcriptional regulator, partial [Burkholderiales bacterium]